MMKMNWVTLVMASGALAFSGAALAGDAAAGKAKAEMCMDCHEPAEDFAGASADEIAGKIKTIVSGQMKHQKKLALSDADVADIAAFFAAADGK
jgi:cytochrome c553